MSSTQKSNPVRQTFRQGVGAIAIASFISGAAGDARAQNLLTITAPVSGRTVDGKLSFAGAASVNTITRGGTVRGRTNTGVECRGTISVNLTFSHGEGSMACGRISTRFAFTLTSRQPPAGTGTGTLSDGRKVVLRIGQ